MRLRSRTLPLPFAIAISAASGLLLSLSEPPVGLGPVAFVALIPFLWVVRESRSRRSVFLGFVFGFAYFGALLYWILLFGELAWVVLTLSQAAYVALFALLAPRLWRAEHPVRSSVGLAALWTGTEYLRGLWPVGGFTWGGLGYSQIDNGFTVPLASITGVWGVTFVVVLVNAFLLLALERLRVRRVAALTLAAVCVAVVFLPAVITIPAANGAPFDVAVVQGNNIEQHLGLYHSGRIRQVTTNHADLHRTLAPDPPDLAVWPEDAVDSDPRRDPELYSIVTGAIREAGAPTLVGAITNDDEGRFYNQSLLYDGTGRIIDRYTKVHLVPFGEYVPWRKYLDFLSALEQIPRDLTPGKRPNLLHIGSVTFADVICFEDAFGSIDRRLVNGGAEFVVVSTNDASYGRTAASRQHLILSRMRAVENARWFVHAAVSGISAFIDPEGHVHDRTALYELAVPRRTIRLSTTRTIYTRFGDYFPWASLGVAFLLLLPPRRRREQRSAPSLPAGPRTLVILPTYNERDTVEEVLTRLRALDPAPSVMVVDDSSPDGTADVVRAVAERDPGVRLLVRPEKGGLAGAYAAGFQRALEEGFDLVVEMDADLSHQPEELPRLLEGAERLDLTIGSRYMPGGSVTNWGFLRRILSRGGNLYAKAMLQVPIEDSTTGFRVYRQGLLRHLLENGLHHDGYGFQIELAYQSWQDGFAVGEVPITFREREHGQSKISRRIVFEALWLITVWGIRDRFPRRKQAQANPR